MGTLVNLNNGRNNWIQNNKTKEEAEINNNRPKKQTTPRT